MKFCAPPLMLKLRFVAYIGILGFVLLSTAQQSQVYNQFFMNPYIYNPAYAGVDGHPVLFAMYKQQWVKIPEGPRLIHASYHAPLRGGTGIGVAIFRDAQGPLNSTAFKASGSYLINLDRKHFLRLGMSFGLGSNQLTLPEDAINDPAFQGENSMYLVGDFGASYHFGHFNAGFALPKLFSSEVATEKKLVPPKVKPIDNILFKMNYRGHINHAIAIEPHVIYRFSSIVPSQYEFTTIVHVKHIMWLGGTYRQDAGLVGLVGVKFKNKIAIGGAFELGNENYGKLTGPSFEIHMGIHLGRHKDHERSHINHNSSFLRTHSQALLDAKAKKDSIAVIKQAIDDFRNSNNPDALDTVVDPVVDATDPPQDIPGKWNAHPEPISRTNAIGKAETGQRWERTNAAGEKEIITGFPPQRDGGAAWALAPGASQLLERTRPDGTKEVGIKWVRVNANGTLEQTIKWDPILDEANAAAALARTTPKRANDPIDGPKKNRRATEKAIRENPILDNPRDNSIDVPAVSGHITDAVSTPDSQSYKNPSGSKKYLEVTRGNHRLELPVGNHVIGGVFSDLDGADKESDKLFRRGIHDVKVGYVSARRGYYVVVGSFASVTQAQREKDRIKLNYDLKDIWVLKVKN